MGGEGRIEFAVKALIFNGDRFLGLHKAAVQSQRYELPGGRMIFGETAEETVIREVLEETGLNITPLSLVDTWNYVTETNQVTGVIYLCAVDNTHDVTLSDEHDRYEWLTTDSVSIELMNKLFKPQMRKWDWEALKKLVSEAAGNIRR